jgi:hypothetical protein
MAVTIDGTSGINTPGVVNTAAETIATTLAVTGVTTFAAGTAALPAITTTGDTNTGIFFPAADTIGFAEGGAEAMRIDAFGILGLGVTPSAWGGVYKAIQVGSTAVFGGNTSANRNYSSSNVYWNGSNYKYITTSQATQFEQSDGAYYWLQAASGTAGNNITFTQAMTLDASGNLLVGTTNANAKLHVAQTSATNAINANVNYASSTNVAGIRVTKFDNNTTTAQRFIEFVIDAGATGCGQINANGASTAAFGSYSDERLKENIVDLPSQLANICALRPVEFDYIGVEDGHQIGFIAQEMQQVYPDAVSVGNDEMLMITAWAKTEARLVKAIQEQQALITALTTRITALEAA